MGANEEMGDLQSVEQERLATVVQASNYLIRSDWKGWFLRVFSMHVLLDSDGLAKTNKK